MYNLGFAVYTLFSLVLTVDWMTGPAARLYLVVGRVFQGVGAAFLVANSSAILTDAFPENQRGMALGINNVAGISGSFIGLVLGGILAPINWRLIFLVSVPFGMAGTLWAYFKLQDTSPRAAGAHRLARQHHLRPRADPGHGRHHLRHPALRRPHHGLDQPHRAGRARRRRGVAGGLRRSSRRGSAEPMFRLRLFRIRAFSAGVLSSFLAAVARGGLMFMLIIWLQGIWLPEHGYSFARTPLWAGIYMLPLTAGFLIAGPLSGLLSDRYGSRPFATGGMLVATALLRALGAAAHQLRLLGVRRCCCS